MLIEMKTCLNRLIGRCDGCERDYNAEHHPNNYDCPNYKEVNINIINVIEKEEEEHNHAMDRKIPTTEFL